MSSGSGPGGGPELLPGAVDQLVPHAGEVSGVLAKPLKAAGANPPLSAFAFHHCAPQNVTEDPMVALPSPITKLPAEPEPPPTVAAVAEAASVSAANATGIPSIRVRLSTRTARLDTTTIPDPHVVGNAVAADATYPSARLESNIRLESRIVHASASASLV